MKRGFLLSLILFLIPGVFADVIVGPQEYLIPAAALIVFLVIIIALIFICWWIIRKIKKGKKKRK